MTTSEKSSRTHEPLVRPLIPVHKLSFEGEPIANDTNGSLNYAVIQLAATVFHMFPVILQRRIESNDDDVKHSRGTHGLHIAESAPPSL